jgi:acyl dehydratase
MVKADGPYDIDAVRSQWIGKASEKTRGRYPVEFDPIRRHCHMVEDTNPIFLDPDVAATTRFGGVIAPPVMLDYFAGQGVWPPVVEGPRIMQQVPTRGDRVINLNQEMIFYRPVRVGDHLSSQMVIVDVFEKPIRLDPKAVWITFEIRLTNDDNEPVATIRNTALFHREPEEVAADA